MDYVEQWYKSLVRPGSYDSFLKRRVEAWGEYKKHTGPSIRYAKVKIAVEPSRALEVIDELDPQKAAWLKQAQCYDPITFGVLDVLLTIAAPPINTFKLTILDVDYDDVMSVPMAFRLAAREAARTILTEQAGN